MRWFPPRDTSRTAATTLAAIREASISATSHASCTTPGLAVNEVALVKLRGAPDKR